MWKNPANRLILLLAAVLLAACAGTEPTQAPAASPVAAIPATQAAAPQPSASATATAPPATATPTARATVPAPTATATATATPTVPPTATPTVPPTATPGVDEVLLSLAGLPLDDFFEESYKHLVLRDPRRVTASGLGGLYGVRNDRLEDLSDGYIRETQRLEVAILDLLHGYDRAALSPAQQISYDVYEWVLGSRVRGHAFVYHDYPLNQYLNGYVYELNELLTELHPLEDRQDVEDYVARLSQVDDQVAQLLESLALREEMGVVSPDFILWQARRNLLWALGTDTADAATIRAPSLAVYTVLSDALQEMDDLSAEEKTAFREAALEAIRSSYIPGLLEVVGAIDRQSALASNEAGAWKLPDGEAYYAYMLRHETSTDLTPQQIHEMGLAEVARIHAELRAVFDELGYPQDQPVGALIQRAIGEGGLVSPSLVVGTYEALIADIDQRVDEVFDLRPRAAVVVIGDSAFGGYYTPAAADGSRPAAFYAFVSGSGTNRAEMPTIAYHEAVPGHHFQDALVQELDLPTFRYAEFFNAHGEGWALYAERLAWELGAYEDDPYGNVGRLRLELLRAARLVVDTGLHALRWTREEARDYLQENVGGWSHEVERYVAWPAQATGYKIGMLKILELRQRAMDQLGDRFDLKAFHNVLLGNGTLPLDVLERLVDEYIAANRLPGQG